MARSARPAPVDVADGTTTEILQSKGRALAEQARMSLDVAVAYGDGLPYERERIVGQARVFMATSAEAMLELGKCLLQIKENEPHGAFTEIVTERLGIPARTASRFMAAALKFLAPGTKTATLAVLGKSKLFELMDEDDNDLAQLAEGGTLAGATLDEMQTMSARELRAALLEERQKAAAKDKVIAKKDAKLNQLAEAEEIRRNGASDEREKQQINDLRDEGIGAELALQRLVTRVAEVMDDPATESAALQARQTLDFIAQRLADLCADQHVAVDVLGERVEPGWRRQITDLAAAAQAVNGKRGGRA